MVKLMETKLLWTGPSLRVKVALEAVVEAEVALEAEVVAEEAEVDLVAEAGEALEALEVRRLGGFVVYVLGTVAHALKNVPRAQGPLSQSPGSHWSLWGGEGFRQLCT